MTKHTLKEQITLVVIEQLDDNTLTFDHAMKNWWQNPRRDGPLRLSSIGDLNFRLAKIEYYDHTISTKTKSYYQFITELSKKIKCPYYIDINNSNNKPYIRLYDDRISMMLNLYGDLDSYLKSVRTK